MKFVMAQLVPADSENPMPMTQTRERGERKLDSPRMGRERAQPDTKTYSGRFAKRLRELRERSGMTTDEFATRAGVTVASAYAWERGKNFPDADKLPLLAKVLGCESVGDLFPKR